MLYARRPLAYTKPCTRSGSPTAPVRRLRSLCLAALLLLALALPGRADPANDFARPGLYVALGLALGVDNYQWIEDLDARARASGGGFPVAVTGYSATNLIGANVAVGQRLTRRLAIEGAFDWARGDLLADFSVQPTPFSRNRFTAKVAEIETWIVTLNGRFYLLTGRFQPYALAGIGAIGATPVDRNGRQRDAAGFASRLGGGIDFYITRQVVLTTGLSYVFATGDTDRSSLLEFNGSFAFRY